MATRVGMRYMTGPKGRPYVPGDPFFRFYTVVDDDCWVAGHVTVQNVGGQRFAVPGSLVDEFAMREAVPG